MNVSISTLLLGNILSRYRARSNGLWRKPRLEKALSKQGGKAGVKSGESLLLKWIENNVGKYSQNHLLHGNKIRQVDVEK